MPCLHVQLSLSVCLGGSVNIIARTEISCSVQLRQLKHFLCSFMVYLPKSSSNSRAKAGAASQHLSENKQSKCRAEDEGAAAAAAVAGERQVVAGQTAVPRFDGHFRLSGLFQWRQQQQQLEGN